MRAAFNADAACSPFTITVVNTALGKTISVNGGKGREIFWQKFVLEKTKA